MRGSAWTIAGFGAQQVMRLGSNLVLTRLLTPSVFGVMQLVVVLRLSLGAFSEVGIRPSVCRDPRGDDPEFIGTAWTIQVVRGLVLTAFCAALAWPYAQFYDLPVLFWLVMVLATINVVEGVQSISIIVEQRHLRLGPNTAIELGSYTIGLVVMVGWAILDASVWALVAGTLVQSVLRTFMSFLFLPPPASWLRWNADSARRILGFGKWVFVATVLGLVGSQVDRLVIGKLIDIETLGIYSIAFMLTNMVRALMAKLAIQVVLPSVAARQHLARAELRKLIIRSRWMPLFVLAVGLGLLTMFCDQVILLLWDQRYQDAAWMAPILAIGMWPTALNMTIGQALPAIGKPNYMALAAGVRFVGIVVGLFVGYMLLGMVGVLIAVALAEVFRYLGFTVGLIRHGLTAFRQDLVATSLFVAILLALGVLRYFIGLDPFAIPPASFFHPA